MGSGYRPREIIRRGLLNDLRQCLDNRAKKETLVRSGQSDLLRSTYRHPKGDTLMDLADQCQSDIAI